MFALRSLAICVFLASTSIAQQKSPAHRALLEDADRALRLDPPAVVHKKLTPPSGDKHDYMSVGPYWWPDPSKPDGLPYIRRDGEQNPARGSADTDRASLGRMASAVETLALAYRETGREEYAAHASKLLRVWFLDPATRMNPHLKFGQGIPGRVEGRAAGIIDTAGFVPLVRSLEWLDRSKSWDSASKRELQKWLVSYISWLRTSEIGKDEAAATNNHGVWYDAQIAYFAHYAGDQDLARQVIEEVKTRRIARQIEPDGRQPREIERTRSFSYSVMNLRAFFELASLGERVKVDLWTYQTADGRSIRKALDFLTPYLEKDWPHQQLGGMNGPRMEMAPLLRRAWIAFEEPKYEAMLRLLPADAISAHRLQLLWPRK